MIIMISHGSGGIGSAEKFTKDYFENKGYQVVLNDYFTPHNIPYLRWHEENPDNYEVSFKEMFDVEFPKDDIIHIGFSLGAFFGLYHTEKFKKNFLFYPGVIGFTQKMLEKDYSNCSVILGMEDNGNYKYENFKSKLAKPPMAHYYLVDTHHAFMIEDIDKEFDMVRYDCLDVMSEEEFSLLKPNHAYMSSKYGCKNTKQILRTNKEFRWSYLDRILEDIECL